jgi:hypothetical protein
MPLWVNAMAEMFNFQWSVQKFPNEEWGTSPIGGNWSNPNPTFVGIFGKYFFYVLIVTLLLLIKSFKQWLPFDTDFLLKNRDCN